MSCLTTTSGVRLVPAPARPGPDGQPVERVGIWADDDPVTRRGPVVLSTDEVAVALAHCGEAPSKWGYRLLDDTARKTLAGVAAVGRGELARLVERWRVGNELEIWPAGYQTKCLRQADELARKAHRGPRLN
ncbi:hypothetical protein [Amycolatopsis suaedae]|uniref:Uncharacterized protein n=1 Tax=Amycolatopsis suaedae TaxID=2510978 RepID=A0A4Q7JAW7_9PSEU|nr:hypothetical protein [Amycolatopsis suaedae]RZQ64417.1 hypothetical protein EWH70_10685 [Amycolatopsis suaedae]